VREVFALMSGEIEPLLPPAGGLAVELDVVVDDAGEVTEASVVVTGEGDAGSLPGALDADDGNGRRIEPGTTPADRPPSGAATPPNVAPSASSA
jgi:hypothetical protein